MTDNVATDSDHVGETGAATATAPDPTRKRRRLLRWLRPDNQRGAVNWLLAIGLALAISAVVIIGFINNGFGLFGRSQDAVAQQNLVAAAAELEILYDRTNRLGWDALPGLDSSTVSGKLGILGANHGTEGESAVAAAECALAKALDERLQSVEVLALGYSGTDSESADKDATGDMLVAKPNTCNAAAAAAAVPTTYFTAPANVGTADELAQALGDGKVWIDIAANINSGTAVVERGKVGGDLNGSADNGGASRDGVVAVGARSGSGNTYCILLVLGDNGGADGVALGTRYHMSRKAPANGDLLVLPDGDANTNNEWANCMIRDVVTSTSKAGYNTRSFPNID